MRAAGAGGLASPVEVGDLRARLGQAVGRGDRHAGRARALEQRRRDRAAAEQGAAQRAGARRPASSSAGERRRDERDERRVPAGRAHAAASVEALVQHAVVA